MRILVGIRVEGPSGKQKIPISVDIGWLPKRGGWAIMRAPLLCLSAFALLLPMDSPAQKAVKGQGDLWASITVSKAVFEEGEGTSSLQIHFALVNDGKKLVDPEIKSSQLLVNDKELKDWAFIIAGGPRDARFTALPPGDYLSFSYALGKHFAKPGIYKLHWKGKGFDAPEIVFRVVPKIPN
jgi:hypothetical protein